MIEFKGSQGPVWIDPKAVTMIQQVNGMAEVTCWIYVQGGACANVKLSGQQVMLTLKRGAENA